MLIDPATKRAAEFVFTFQCNGPFGLYCHAVDVMDDLVFSFKWGAGAADKLEKALAGPLIEQAPATSEEIVDPPPANQLNIAVSAVAQKEELTRAIASFEKALEISTQVKSRAALLFSLGEVHEKSGDEEKAIQCYAQSVENNPAQINSLHNIATIYIRRGEYRQALEHLVKVDKSYLSHSMINDIILCYDKLGEAGQADQWRDILSHKAGPFFG
jgi:tetratricopeptide (TPR) repeat protein